MKIITPLCASVALAALMLIANPAAAEEQCQTLWAGQHHDAGEVCVSNDNDNITITVTGHNGFDIYDTQLALGLDLSDIPTNRAGNPIIGHFPYTGVPENNTYTYTFPLSQFGATCDSMFYIALHANTSGDETAWAAGDRFVQRGSWATYFTYQASCDTPPPPPNGDLACETAYAFGNVALNTLGQANRWGWAIEGIAGGDSAQGVTIWADAGGNDTSKGVDVGYINYSFSSSGWLTVDVFAHPDMYFTEAQLFAGTGYPNNVAANGSFPFKWNNATGSSTIFFAEEVDGDPINMILHLVACFPEDLKAD